MILIQLFGLLVVVLFYGCYFGKMLLLRRHGIKTDRMGRGTKPKRTYVIEIILKAVTYAMASVQVASIIINDKWLLLIPNDSARYIGIGVSILGLIVFVIAMTTMRESWRAGIDVSQKTTIVKSGIYKLSRNPAFLGFDLFYIGLTLSFCNLLQLIFLCFSVYMLHLQILEEEKYLPTIFGKEYLNYKKTTGRYFLSF
ncbi:isoprenylcysteine carboxylmethyltransferase family protein [Desulfosporosinus sp.]|uniref:methyltransferase family protein n=1 Tax=Desulfosporosinus sp. TaxID=157907 RepID=UPI0025BE0E19|nr:isoprenylcysteine carboxylmethyltransferase family protein [Desulfosporosinus sp.]MBC2727403.1 isoprenylcysteine carboxylmethyltransferase family protein [Desulfosporosinus sp.]